MPYCDTCDRFFNSEHAIRTHRIHSNRHNYCAKCDRDFSAYSSLRSHYMNSSYHDYCDWCDEDFDGAEELEEHNDDVHYTCGSCSNLYRDEEDLDEHIEDCHWYCSPCDKFFMNQNNLNQHLNSNIHKPKDFVCPGRGCSRGFISWSALIKHFEGGTCPSGLNRDQLNKLVVRMDRNNMITDPSRLITGPGGRIEPATTTTTWATQRSYNGYSYECFLCHREFRYLTSLNQHLQSGVHAEKIYRCPNRGNCGQQFTLLSALTAHVEGGRCGVQQFREVRAVMESLSSNIRSIAY